MFEYICQYGCPWSRKQQLEPVLDEHTGDVNVPAAAILPPRCGGGAEIFPDVP